MGGTSSVLRWLAAFAAVIVWFEFGPRLPYAGHWGSVLLVALVVIPGTLALVLLALPLARSDWRVLAGATVVLSLLALAFSEAGWGLPTNFAKLGAAVFAGWAFVTFFEQLSWVVLVAVVIPFVDILSVYRGPTHAITTHHFHVYTDVSVAFVVPGHRAAYLGPPDILFYALFLAAAQRWRLNVPLTWIATTGMYSLAVVIANAAHVNGLPALPFLSVGFLGANAKYLWALRASKPSASGGRPVR